MAGLLDAMNDPVMAGAMGLLSAAGPSRMPVSMGQALGAGYGEFQQAQNMQAKRKFMDMQMQQEQMQMQEMQRRQQQAQAIRDLASRSVLSPQQQAIGAGGPTQAAADMIPGLKPKFDTEGFLGGMMGIDPLQAIQMRESMKKKPIKAGLDDVFLDPETMRPVWQGTGKEAALPWYAKKGPDGRISIDPAFAEFEKTKASFGRPPAQPMAPVAYVDDKGQTIWGTINEARGRPAANFNPMVQGALAGAKESAKTEAEERTKAALDAPRIIQNSETALRLVDDLGKHPGFEQAVGASSMLGIQKIPGTKARDFMNRLDQIKGGAFLEAFNSLKGGGQITEVEGKKATDAIARMDNATSEPEFKAALKDYESVIRLGMGRAKMKARPVGPVTPAEQPAPAAGAKFLGFE